METKFSIEEIGAKLGISTAQAYIWRKEGKFDMFKSVKIGRQHWYFVDEKRLAKTLVNLNSPIKSQLLRLQILFQKWEDQIEKEKENVESLLRNLITADLVASERHLSRKNKKQ